MNHSDIAALMKGVAPVIAELVASTVRPLVSQVAALQQEIAELRAVDHAAQLASLVADEVAKIPPALPGKDGLSGKDGVDGKDGSDGKDGAGVTASDLEPAIALAVAAYLEANPPAPGKDGAPGEKGDPGRDGIDGKDGLAGADGRDGLNGKDGADGLLPVAKEWQDEVHREGVVVIHNGATYQATRDTGKEPPHADWICLAAAGAPGKSADEIEVLGTFEPDHAYKRLNIVALNGAAFMARKDAPGPCPGPDWQVIAMRGKPGEPGKKGDQGARGMPGPGLSDLSIDGEGLLKAKNADGSIVACDMYPLLSKVV